MGRRGRLLLVATYSWAPLIAVYVLLGFALGWWVAILAAGPAILIACALLFRRRRGRDDAAG